MNKDLPTIRQLQDMRNTIIQICESKYTDDIDLMKWTGFLSYVEEMIHKMNCIDDAEGSY